MGILRDLVAGFGGVGEIGYICNSVAELRVT